MPSPSILLVDDDVELAELMGQFLRQNDFLVSLCHHGDEAEAALRELQPDLLVLDLMLPGTDGLSICRAVRDEFKGPIIMLTALGDEIDEVTGLELGADDYLAKPIKPRVLLAHVRAQLRRYERDTPREGAMETAIVTSGDLSINAGRREALRGGDLIPLTSAEFDLLWLLAENQGSPVTRDELYRRIYRLEFDGLDRSIDLRVSKLRRKLGDDDLGQPFIRTVRGVGYQLVQ